MTTNPGSRGRLVCQAVSVAFERADGGVVHALRGVTLTIEPGEYVVVIGANGAGKSTVVNVACGHVPPTQGSVTLDGIAVAELSDFERSRVISRVHQDPSVGVCGELTIEENMALGLTTGRRRSLIRSAKSKTRLAQSAKLLVDYRRGLEMRMTQQASTLSGGQRQLVALAVATARLPRLLLLDEHTSALDPSIGLTVMERTDALVRETSITTLMVTHNMRHAARYGDRLLIMANGRIVRDINGDDKRDLDEHSLVDLFRSSVADQITDRMLG